VRRAALVFGGAALVVVVVIGAARLTGVGDERLTAIGISYDFEPVTGTHGGTVATAVKSDPEAFGATYGLTVSKVADLPARACYLVHADAAAGMTSLVEIDGEGAGSVGGVSRWTGKNWDAAPGKARAAQCESETPAPRS
jgi:hypothetical protein